MAHAEAGVVWLHECLVWPAGAVQLPWSCFQKHRQDMRMEQASIKLTHLLAILQTAICSVTLQWYTLCFNRLLCGLVGRLTESCSVQQLENWPDQDYALLLLAMCIHQHGHCNMLSASLYFGLPLQLA